MKCCTQVYVMNSIEAVDMYCRAFGAKVTFEIKNEDQNAYEHCELSVNDVLILAVAEAPKTYAYDVNVIHQMKWQTMTFNAFELGSIGAVEKALNVLSEGGIVIEKIHEVPWSKCCATVIDKYGVCWWISI